MPLIASAYQNNPDRVPFDFTEIVASFAPRPFLLWTVTGNGGYLRGQGALVGVLVRAVAMTAALTGLEIGLVALCFVALHKRSASLDLWLWLISAAVAVTW